MHFTKQFEISFTGVVVYSEARLYISYIIVFL